MDIASDMIELGCGCLVGGICLAGAIVAVSAAAWVAFKIFGVV